MRFTIQRQSDIFDVVREINETISSMEAELDNQLHVADAATADARQLREGFATPGSSIWNLYKAMGGFNRAAACRTHDVELAITETRGQRLMGNIVISPFEVNLSGFKLVATPVGRPVIRWSDPALSLPDSFLMDLTWNLVADGSSPETVILRMDLRFVLGSAANGKLKLVQTQSPRILDEQGRRKDIFSQVPMRDGMRAKARKQLFSKITELVDNIEIALPDNPLGEGAAKFQPHTYLVDRSLLSFVCRQLGKRRTAEPLGFTIFRSHDQGIRLKKEHLIARMRKEVASQGATLQTLDFRQGYLFLRVSRGQSRSCGWIDINVTVRLDYRMDISQDGPGVLFCDLHCTEWSADIDIDRCWPICGRIMDHVKDQVRSEVPKYFHLTFPFADLRQTARDISSRIQPYGVIITMKTR